jgi:hypothetical protein
MGGIVVDGDTGFRNLEKYTQSPLRLSKLARSFRRNLYSTRDCGSDFPVFQCQQSCDGAATRSYRTS